MTVAGGRVHRGLDRLLSRLASKLPLFIGLVVVLSALLLFVMFRSLVIPVQAAVMNLLTIGAALGVTVRCSRTASSLASSGSRRARSRRGYR